MMIQRNRRQASFETPCPARASSGRLARSARVLVPGTASRARDKPGVFNAGFVAFCCVMLALALPAGSAQTPAPKEPTLRAELVRRVKDDQDARKAFIAFLQKQPGGIVARARAADPPEVERMRSIDADNRAWL